MIRFGSNPHWAPVEFTDREGVPRGISRDYLERFGKALGVDFRHVPVPAWWQAQDMLREGQVDLLTSLTKASARKQDFAFTPPYLSLPAAIFTRADTSTSTTAAATCAACRSPSTAVRRRCARLSR